MLEAFAIAAQLQHFCSSKESAPIVTDEDVSGEECEDSEDRRPQRSQSSGFEMGTHSESGGFRLNGCGPVDSGNMLEQRLSSGIP